jgi:hypothetical protein
VNTVMNKFCKMSGNSLLAERLLASQEGLGSMKLVIMSERELQSRVAIFITPCVKMSGNSVALLLQSSQKT